MLSGAVLLGGCGTGGVNETGDAVTEASPRAPDGPSTRTTSPPGEGADPVSAPPSAGPSGDPHSPPPAGAEEVAVRSVTDGDTLDVTLADGSTATVRLIGIDAPETGECFGERSTRALAALAPPGERVAMTTDVSDRDQFDRLLRYLWAGGMSVNEEAVRRGAAVARRYPPDTAMAERLDEAQANASSAGRGLWDADVCGPAADAALHIVELVFDAPGDDSLNLNGEWVAIRNEGEQPVGLGGWTVRDESAGHRYAFPPTFSLPAGSVVTIFSGCGDDTDNTLFWCNTGSAVWNNDGDTAFLLDPHGNTHDSWDY